MDFSFSDLNFNSVETLPGFEARAAFTVNSASVFKEDVDMVPTIVDDKLSYVPWGGDNQMPFDLLALVEKDETLATCQCFNAEVCYGSGLQYCTTEASAKVKNDVEDFLLDNDLAAYFLGICQDFKHFGFAVSVLILNEDGTRIVRLLRKEACYCRFTPADKHGRISKILYANWRKPISSRSDIEEIDLLDPTSPWRDLQDKLAKKSRVRKFAIVSRIPTVDSTYYPIPYYGALFRGKWYNIKQLIGIAKEAKLKNSAPIKYHIEVGAKYWESIFRAEGITDRRKQQERIVREKQQILDFLTGAENSGKAWFSTFYVTPDGKEQHDVVINKIDPLRGLPKLKVCVAYKLKNGETVTEFPANFMDLVDCEPVYEEFDGFTEDITNCRSFDELPATVQAYIKELERIIECPITMLGVGPARDQVMEISI